MKRFKVLSVIAVLALLGLGATQLFDAPADEGDKASSETTPAERAAPPEVGSPAPDFTLKGTDGQTYTLSDLEGNYVVLEWLNFGCPYVGKYYNSGKMQELQQTYRDQGVKWFSVVSSAPGKQGYYPPEEMNAKNAEYGANQTAILMDPKGDVGRMYGAKTTPHMYVINPEGTLIYKGGIDDKPTTSQADLAPATNYVVQALKVSMNGEEVETKTAPPYGCSVKYAAK